MRWCDGSYLEYAFVSFSLDVTSCRDQDKWWLSGIYREVYLLHKPRIMISDYEFNADISWGSSIVATANVEIICESSEDPRKLPFARVELWDTKASAPETIVTKELTKGSCLPSMFSTASQSIRVDPFESEVNLQIPKYSSKAEVSFVVKTPRLWCSENPELYLLIISLHASHAEAEAGVASIDSESCRVAFREILIGGDENQLMVNRIPITVAGVNRHEFHPNSGRAVSEESMREDAALMKRFNFNAVRCSHYPNHHRWLEICDEAGLYVVDEANIETHGFQMLGQPVNYLSNLRSWRGAHLSRFVRMLERDKNYSCVIMWSLGNESGLGETHKLMSKWARLRDCRRYVHYEAGGARSVATDVICPMYQRPWWCRRQAVSDKARRPVILCEYAHAMGNSGGGFFKYWRDFRNPQLPRLQGGFVWDWVDQGLALGNDKFGYGGDFGDIPNTKQFCINGLFGPDRKPHPAAHEAKALQAPVFFELKDNGTGALVLCMGYFSSNFNIDDVCVYLSLGCDMQNAKSKPLIQELPGNTLLKGKTITELFPSLQQRDTAATSQLFGIEADALSQSAEVWLHVVARTYISSPWIPAHHELMRTSLSHPMLSQLIFEKLSRPTATVMPTHSPIVSERDGLLIIEWGDSSKATLGIQCGRLLSWEHHGKIILTKPLDACIWRAPTDNVC